MLRTSIAFTGALLFAACGGSGAKQTSNPCANPCADNPCANPCGGNVCGSGGGGGSAPSSDTGVDWTGWKSWTRANETAFASEGHAGAAFVDVYVTPAHAKTYANLTGTMPQGMAIVKVGYADDGGKPGAAKTLTVMAKMAPGYDPDNGDWYYGVLSPDGTRAMKQGKIGMCINCHAGADVDYLFGVPKK